MSNPLEQTVDNAHIILHCTENNKQYSHVNIEESQSVYNKLKRNQLNINMPTQNHKIIITRDLDWIPQNKTIEDKYLRKNIAPVNYRKNNCYESARLDQIWYCEEESKIACYTKRKRQYIMYVLCWKRAWQNNWLHIGTEFGMNEC